MINYFLNSVSPSFAWLNNPLRVVHHCLFFISSSIILNNSGFFLNAHSFKYLSRSLNFNCVLSSFADACFQKSMSSDLLTLMPDITTLSSLAPTDLTRFLAPALASALASALALTLGACDLALASIFLRFLIFLPPFPLI